MCANNELFRGMGNIDIPSTVRAIKFYTENDNIDVNSINKESKKGLLYITKDGCLLPTADSPNEMVAKYKLVPTGLREKTTGFPVVASFVKANNIWNGVFIGTPYQLIKGFKEHKNTKVFKEDFVKYFGGERRDCDIIGFGMNEINLNYDLKGTEPEKKKRGRPKKVTNTEKDKPSFDLLDLDYEIVDKAFAISNKDDLSERIFEQLLIKEKWKRNTPKRNRLLFYLYSLTTAVSIQISSSQKPKGYLLNTDKNKVLINTGLVNIYGKFIYIIDSSIFVADPNKKKIEIMQSKQQLLGMGFKATQIKELPEPYSFVKKNDELIFNAEEVDFDFEDTLHLKHIIKERIYRFPKGYDKLSFLDLKNKIDTAIKLAITISKVDKNYVVPKYDFNRHKIQFLIPLHLETSLDEKPELLIVVGEESGVWTPYTVLSPEDAYDSARVIKLPPDKWIG